ncbi:protein FosB isoform X2 [Nematostella vectensis]|nr:protein FosB isoform X2 [Nematostella vectensis]
MATNTTYAPSGSSHGAVSAPVKEELKHVIQSRRACQGLGRLSLPIVTEKKPPPKLTPAEELKIIRRRQRNKQAASRCREKRRQRLEELQREATELEEQNAEVERDIATLIVEYNELEALLTEHACVLPYGAGDHVGRQLGPPL